MAFDKTLMIYSSAFPLSAYCIRIVEQGVGENHYLDCIFNEIFIPSLNYYIMPLNCENQPYGQRSVKLSVSGRHDVEIT